MAQEATSGTTREGKGTWSFFDVRAALFMPSEGWITVALLLAMNLVVIFNVMNSGWVSPAPRLWIVAVLAMLFSLGAAKYRGPVLMQLFVHAFVLALGFGVALAETANALAGTAGAKFDEMFTRLDEWLGAITAEGISNDRLPFIFIMVASTWLIMYLSTVFTFRMRWTWLAVIPPALGLMTNLTYLPSSHYPVPVFFFLLFAILFMGRTHFLRRIGQWTSQMLDYRGRRFAFLANALMLTAIVLAIGWAIPTGRFTVGAFKDTYRTARSPWRALENDFERMFAGIPSQRGGPLHSFGVALPLRGRVGLGTEEVMTVTTDFPSYWRAQTYDFYEGRGWIANSDQRERVKDTEVRVVGQGEGYGKREVVAAQVTMKAEAEVIFSAGDPLDVNIDTEVEVSIPRLFEISLRDAPEEGALPPDLQLAAELIAGSRGSLEEIRGFLPPGTRIEDDKSDALIITRDEPEIPDVLSVRSKKRLKPDSSYEVLSSVSIATLSDLRRAGIGYPRWVTDNYLQLPPALPDRVRELASNITAPANNPYDKALLVELFLRGYQESFAIESPPLNVDAVDYFLFTQRAGYSDYFASAMAVLLRSSGIPSRLAAGYSAGTFDEQTSSFSVRQSDAHSWPEVFFPGLGWVVFEPSPALEGIGRGPLEQLQTAGFGLDDLQSIEDILGEDFLPDEEFLTDFLSPEDDPLAGEVLSDVGKTIGIVIGAIAAAIVGLFVLFAAVWQVNFIGLPYASGLYSRMTKLGTLTWRGPNGWETPAEYAQNLSAALAVKPEQTGAVAGGFMKSRYGARSLSDEDRISMQQAWRGVRTTLFRRLFRRFNVLELLRRDR